MAWTRYQFTLALVMIITGSINTLSTKWADELSSIGRDGVLKKFNHPFFQTSAMFLGEVACLLTFKILYRIFSMRADGTEDVHELTKGSRTFSPLLLFIPAMCDMTATSIMYVGLNLTYASSFQMLRGSVIVFTGLLSAGFLEKIINRKQWSGICLVITGLAIVGVADFVSKDTNADNHGKNDILTGDMLIIIAQIIQSIQMVVEEKFIRGKDIPSLQAVGWEGTFGFLVLGLLLVPFYYIRADPPFTENPGDHLEDVIDAFYQVGNNWRLFMAVLGTFVSIAFFNFAGVSVTKELSATTRMVLDSVRTIIIWIFSLAFLGQPFHWLQLLGFFLLLVGMCLYNEISFVNEFIMLKAFISRRYHHDDEEAIVNRNADDTEP